MYTPSEEILDKYADVMVNFALNSGEGINKKETVYLAFEAEALPLAKKVYKKILEKEAYPMYDMLEEDFSKIRYDIAKKHQLEYFPKKYWKGLIDTIDHRIFLIADRDPMLLKDVDPKKIMQSKKKMKTIRKWMNEKEDAGEFTWSLCLYGTEGLAKEAELSIEEYWNQIKLACFLDQKDPIQKWKKVFEGMNKNLEALNNLDIETLHIEAKNTDLTIKMGEKRKWVGGSGRNIPSFEIFTSPDWRGTNGKIFFDLPLYRYGNIIEDIYLEFEDGKVTKAKAGKNEDLLKELVKQKDANKIGEFSLTDSNFSKISKFMATTLYDENYGGEWGNTHLALGSSYHDAYDGDPQKVSDEEWKEMGYNESQEHCDIMQKQNRKVTATLKGGKKMVIYEDGHFQVT